MIALVTRADIAAALKITTKQLSELAYKRQICLPPVVERRRVILYYSAKRAEEFINSDPLNKESRLTKAYQRVPVPILDNALALSFITRPKLSTRKPVTMAELAKKHGTTKDGKAKTTVIHLKEHHGYTPPHSQLTRFSNSGADHRISVSF